MNMCVNSAGIPTLEITPENPDNIVLLGADAQRTITDISQKMSGILLSGNEDLELAICDIIDEVDAFQNLLLSKSRRSVFNWLPSSRVTIVREYNLLLASFDKIVLGLQLQEAQLLKEISVIKQLRSQLQHAEALLNSDIHHGESTLCQAKPSTEGIEKSFFSRLSKKVEDLRISCVVLQQTQAQLQMLQDAHSAMIDQIVTAISTTIPLWRNQISLLLGFEKISYEQSVQDKLLAITKGNSKVISNNKKIAKLLDFSRLSSVNGNIVSSLKQLLSSTTKEKEIRKKLEMSYFQNKSWR